MDGILNINKPGKLTSFDIVARVRKITRERHAGHAGTLDPLASGVLPICLGKATRTIEYLFDETKTYLAEIELGVNTDTYDSTGNIIKTADTSNITSEMVEHALVAFRGRILQIPPMYSALKRNGTPLYALARNGIEVERKSRPVQIDKLKITSWDPPIFGLEIVCGKGTYIRSLANDIGEALGCGAMMKSLVRSRVGPFNLEESVTLEQIAEKFNRGQLESYLYPVDYALQSFDAFVVNHEQHCSLRHGTAVSLTARHKTALARVYNQNGEFVGMVKWDGANELWKPEKIFLDDCCQRRLE